MSRWRPTAATAVVVERTDGGYPASGVINGDRKGLNWGNGGGWNGRDGERLAGLAGGAVQRPPADRRDRRLHGAGQLHGAERADAEHDVQRSTGCGTSWCSTGRAAPGQTVPGGERAEQHARLAAVQLRAGDDVADSRVGDAGRLASHSRLVEVEAYAVWGRSTSRPASR